MSRTTSSLALAMTSDNSKSSTDTPVCSAISSKSNLQRELVAGTVKPQVDDRLINGLLQVLDHGCRQCQLDSVFLVIHLHRQC